MSMESSPSPSRHRIVGYLTFAIVTFTTAGTYVMVYGFHRSPVHELVLAGGLLALAGVVVSFVNGRHIEHRLDHPMGHAHRWMARASLLGLVLTLAFQASDDHIGATVAATVTWLSFVCLIVTAVLTRRAIRSNQRALADPELDEQRHSAA